MANFRKPPVVTTNLKNSAELYSNENQYITGKLFVNGGITGSITTASFSFSSSYANTSSYSPNTLVTASAISNDITFTKGDGSTFVVTVGSSTVTGSLLTTASFSDPNLIFTKGDGSEFNVDISSLTVTSASYAFNATSASYAVSASYEIIKELSSSYADTASFAQSGNGIFSGSFSGSFIGDGSGLTGVVSSSYALSASYSLNSELLDGKDSTTFATTGSNIFIGNQTVTGSLFTSGSNTLIGSTTLTGSLNITGSTTQVGNNILLGNTTLSGSIIISGSLGSVPTVKIYGDTQHNGYIRFDPVTTNIDQSISASYIYVSGSTNDLYFTQNGKGYNNTTRLRWLEGNIYTGLLHGGVVTGSVGGTTFDVTAGAGIIVSLNATTSSIEEGPYPTINYVKWNDFTNITPTYLTTADTTWLSIDAGGNLVQQTDAISNGQFDTNIQLGSLTHPNKTTISIFKTFTITSYGLAQQTYEFIRTFGAIKVSGHRINPSGSTLYVNRDEGVSFALGRNYINDANKPSYIADEGYNSPTLFKYYKSGSVFLTSTGVNTIDPNVYNTPSTPTGLSAVPGGQYTIKRFFYFPNQPDLLGVYYGRQLYNSISTALANLPYEPFEENDNTLTQAIFCGYLIVKGAATDLSNTSDAKFIQAGTFRNTLSGGGGATTSNLNALSDVTISTPTNKQLLVYDSGISQWVNTKTGLSLTGSLQGTAATASYVNPLIQTVIITGSVDVANGNINLEDNAFFLQGTSVGGGTVSLIGVNSSDQTYIGTQGLTNILADSTIISGSLEVSGSLILPTLSESVANALVSYNTSSKEVFYTNDPILNSLTVNNNINVGGNLQVTGSFISSGSITTKTTRVTGDAYTILNTDYRIGVRFSLTGSCTLQLPNANKGELDLRIKDEEGNADTNPIIISASVGNLIDGLPAVILDRNYIAISLYNDGINNWYIE